VCTFDEREFALRDENNGRKVASIRLSGCSSIRMVEMTRVDGNNEIFVVFTKRGAVAIVLPGRERKKIFIQSMFVPIIKFNQA
jgi:hypothetical protein